MINLRTLSRCPLLLRPVSARILSAEDLSSRETRRTEEAHVFVPPRFERVLPSKYDLQWNILHVRSGGFSFILLLLPCRLLLLLLLRVAHCARHRSRFFSLSIPCPLFRGSATVKDRTPSTARGITILPLEHISHVLPCTTVSSNSRRRFCSLRCDAERTAYRPRARRRKKHPTASIGKQLRLLPTVRAPNPEGSLQSSPTGLSLSLSLSLWTRDRIKSNMYLPYSI